MVEHPGNTEFEERMVSPSEIAMGALGHSPIYENGNVVEFQAVGFDITERKKMELLLQENEARLRIALDSAKLAPFDYNALSGLVGMNAPSYGVSRPANSRITRDLQRVHRRAGGRPAGIGEGRRPGGQVIMNMSSRCVADGSCISFSQVRHLSLVRIGSAGRAACGLLRYHRAQGNGDLLQDNSSCGCHGFYCWRPSNTISDGRNDPVSGRALMGRWEDDHLDYPNHSSSTQRAGGRRSGGRARR
jgi:hypothetical protein